VRFTKTHPAFHAQPLDSRQTNVSEQVPRHTLGLETLFGDSSGGLAVALIIAVDRVYCG
jgi:hypothetical protein